MSATTVGPDSSATAVAPAIVYPPTTLAQLQTLAATGDPTQIHPFKRDVGGDPSCPTSNIYATASIGVTGRELAVDELDYFLQQGYLARPCQAALFLYRSATEPEDKGYTVGRVFLDVHSSEPKHDLEVDVGDITQTPIADVQFAVDF